jgi:hypothetical protein
MPSGPSRVGVVFKVLPNPATLKYPYRLKMTDLRNRTVPANFELDLSRLKKLFEKADPQEYGDYLYQQVFLKSMNDQGQTGKILERWRELLHEAQNEEANGLTVKLEIETTLPDVQALAWEYLFDSESVLALGADQRVIFSRDVDVDAPERDPIAGKPHILLALVSPSQAALDQLAQQCRQLDPQSEINPQEIPARSEADRLSTLFETLRPGLLYTIRSWPQAGGESSARDEIVQALDDGPYHVLHLSCHGVILKDRAYLVLTKADGQVDLVSEDEFADLFKSRPHLRLVLLDACQSAQQSQAGTYSGLAPKLMWQVPAAIGMQRTWYTGIADDRFSRAFYKELCRRGYVDRALQLARSSLRTWRPDRWDWGTPVLYLRLNRGQLFQPPGQATSPQPSRPQVERAEVMRSGGKGLYFGPGTQLKNVEITGRVAGGNIVDGQGMPDDMAKAKPGVGIHFEGAQVQDLKLHGEFAGGHIYRQALAKQASESFGKSEQMQAIRERLAYYNERLNELKAQAERIEASQVAGAEIVGATYKGSLEQERLTRLLDILATRFDLEELRTLCFEMQVNYDDLSGEGIKSKARELISYLKRHERILDLVNIGSQMRPEIRWEDAFGGQVTPTSRDMQPKRPQGLRQLEEEMRDIQDELADLRELLS